MIFASLFALLLSCAKDENFLEPTRGGIDSRIVGPDQPANSVITTDSVYALGTRLENPYSVTNMRAAFRVLATENNVPSNMTESQISTTHYYVKFTPANETQFDTLMANTDIEFYDHPLDYEIIGEGIRTNEQVSETLPNASYASWPISKVLPTDVPYEIIETLFIPDDDVNYGENQTVTNSAGNTYDYDFVENLVTKSLELTDNLEGEDETRASSWSPSGTIKAWDDLIEDYIPIAHVKVRTRRWFTTYSAYTNEQGYYSINKNYKRPANYAIVWESSKWDIRDGLVGQALYNGPKKTGGWNLNIKGGKLQAFATITRACYLHYYDDNMGFPRTSVSRKIKIAYKHKDGDDTLGSFRIGAGAGLLHPHITIFGKIRTEIRKTDDILKTTFHEFAHCADYYRNRTHFNNSDDIIVESWAILAGWALTKQEYVNRGYPNLLYPGNIARDEKGKLLIVENDHVYNYQSWNSERIVNNSIYEVYTPLFVDLYDYSNQYYSHNLSSIYPKDKIHINDISVLIQIRNNCKTLTEIKTYLNNGVDTFGLTVSAINDYFTIYEQHNL